MTNQVNGIMGSSAPVKIALHSTNEFGKALETALQDAKRPYEHWLIHTDGKSLGTDVMKGCHLVIADDPALEYPELAGSESDAPVILILAPDKRSSVEHPVVTRAPTFIVQSEDPPEVPVLTLLDELFLAREGQILGNDWGAFRDLFGKASRAYWRRFEAERPDAVRDKVREWSYALNTDGAHSAIVFIAASEDLPLADAERVLDAFSANIRLCVNLHQIPGHGNLSLSALALG